MTNISVVDRKNKYQQLFPMEEVHYFLTIDGDISLHISRFNYHSFSVNVKIIFSTIDPRKEILLAQNCTYFLTHQFNLCFGCSKTVSLRRFF